VYVCLTRQAVLYRPGFSLLESARSLVAMQTCVAPKIQVLSYCEVRDTRIVYLQTTVQRLYGI
jgi:hypothetical protein